MMRLPRINHPSNQNYKCRKKARKCKTFLTRAKFRVFEFLSVEDSSPDSNLMHQIKSPWNDITPSQFWSQLNFRAPKQQLPEFSCKGQLSGADGYQRKNFASRGRKDDKCIWQRQLGRLFETRVRSPVPSSSTNVLHNQGHSNLRRLVIYHWSTIPLFCF